jgi:hypothetical protein
VLLAGVTLFVLFQPLLAGNAGPDGIGPAVPLFHDGEAGAMVFC